MTRNRSRKERKRKPRSLFIAGLGYEVESVIRPCAPNQNTALVQLKDGRQWEIEYRHLCLECGASAPIEFYGIVGNKDIKTTVQGTGYFDVQRRKRSKRGATGNRSRTGEAGSSVHQGHPAGSRSGDSEDQGLRVNAFGRQEES